MSILIPRRLRGYWQKLGEVEIKVRYGYVGIPHKIFLYSDMFSGILAESGSVQGSGRVLAFGEVKIWWFGAVIV